MADDIHDLTNRHADDAANRLTSSLNQAHDTVMNGLGTRDVEHLIRILDRAHEALWASDGKGIKDAVLDEDATYICARAEEVVTAINGIYLTADRLLKRAEEIRLASADFRNAVELSGDDHY